MTETKQMSVYMTPEVLEKVNELKKVYFDKTYGELLRMMILEGYEALKEKKDEA